MRVIWNSRLGTPERTPGERRGERDQATKTAQPRGANRSHQKEKTNGSTNGCNREAQTPGSPAGDSQKTERRGAKEEAKPTQKEQNKSESTEPKQRTPVVTPGERLGAGVVGAGTSRVEEHATSASHRCKQINEADLGGRVGSSRLG